MCSSFTGGTRWKKKVAEFRASNIELVKERDSLKAKYADVDPEEYKTLKAKAVAGDSSDIVALKMQLVEETSAITMASAITKALGTI